MPNPVDRIDAIDALYHDYFNTDIQTIGPQKNNESKKLFKCKLIFMK